MEETPKKIIESDLMCFICSSVVQKKDKIYIFGKSSIDLPELILSSLNVDVNCYSSNITMFVCKCNCYRSLTKFKRASDDLYAVRKEIEGVFKNRGHQRVKRMLNVDCLDENISKPFFRENVTITSSPLPKLAKVSESIRIPTEDITCTSFKEPNPVGTYASDGQGYGCSFSVSRLPFYIPGVSPVQCHPYGLVLNDLHQPRQRLGVSTCKFIPEELPCPGITSNPSSSHPVSTIEMNTSSPNVHIKCEIP